MKKLVCLLMAAMLVLATGITVSARAVKCDYCGGNCVADNIERDSYLESHYSHWDTVNVTITDYVCQDCGEYAETTVVESTYCPYE
jgi:hypothetical protein